MSEHAPAAVVNVQPAPNYVTRELFDATITPIASDVAEMKGDVKTLVAANERRTAVSSLFQHISMLGATIAAGSIGALIALFAH